MLRHVHERRAFLGSVTVAAAFFCAACDNPPVSPESTPRVELDACAPWSQGPLDRPLPAPVVAMARDSVGQPVAGVPFVWTVTEGGGTVMPAEVVTDETGSAEATWTLGGVPGEHAARAALAAGAPFDVAGSEPEPIIATAIDVLYGVELIGSMVVGGINDRGEIAGWREGPEGENQAVLWDEGVFIDLGHLGGGVSRATAVNEHGQIAGWSETVDGIPHAFFWEDGIMTDLDLQVSRFATLDINDQGQIVGAELSSDPEVSAHAFIWQDGESQLLEGIPTTASSRAIAINDVGQVIGTSEAIPGWGFFWDEGSVYPLDPHELGVPFMPMAINDEGLVVGTVNGIYERGFAWRPDDAGDAAGAPKADPPLRAWTPPTMLGGCSLGGGRWSRSTDVNDAGDVIGAGEVGQNHAQVRADVAGRTLVVNQHIDDPNWSVTNGQHPRIDNLGRIIVPGRNARTGESGIIRLTPRP